MDRPRLLMLITLAEVGGAQSYVAALLPALCEHYEVTLAAHGDGPLREAALAAGADYVALRHVRRALHPLHDARGLAELVALMRRLRPQVVHCNSSKAGVLGRLAAAATRVPVRVFTAHGWAFAAYDGMTGRIYRWSDRLVRPLTSAVVCVAERERALGLQAGTCGERQAVVIHNAVDVRAAPRALLQSDPPRLISVGRLAPPKDPLTLVRALAELPAGSFTALLVGDGPQRPDVETEIARLGLGGAVELAGGRDDVPRLLADSDAFVLSSASEGFPISVLEAMAAGLPVVASDVGGIGEAIVDSEHGLLVAPGDVAALADALRRVVADAQLRARLGGAAHERALARFDLDGFRAAHLALYRDRLPLGLRSTP